MTTPRLGRVPNAVLADLAPDRHSGNAQALFVTIKNVEGHLTHAYRKLDISSRQQLAATFE